MDKVRLQVLGISYSQTQTGAYALVLEEVGGSRRIPIIIGGFEAQAIAIHMEGLKPPRPLTHDLFVSLATAFNISIVEVFINRLENGVFYCEIICENQNTRIKIDARTSDSVALALRFNCPIYTTEEILEKAGVNLKEDVVEERQAGVKKKSKPTNEPKQLFANKTDSELEEMLQEAIEQENYELASLIRDEIKYREEQRGKKRK